MRSLVLLSSTLAPSSPVSASSPRSVWQSPVSYLFGGLAAMTGLIALALLILACSYCHLARAAEDDDARRRRQGDMEQGKTGEGGIHKVPPVFEEKFLVIMAGNQLPTFLATPRFSKASLLAPESTGSHKTPAKSAKEEEAEETEHVNGNDQKSAPAETSTQRDQTD